MAGPTRLAYLACSPWDCQDAGEVCKVREVREARCLRKRWLDQGALHTLHILHTLPAGSDPAPGRVLRQLPGGGRRGMRSTQSVQSTPPKQTVLGKGGWTNALCVLCILCIPSPQAPLFCLARVYFCLALPNLERVIFGIALLCVLACVCLVLVDSCWPCNGFAARQLFVVLPLFLSCLRFCRAFVRLLAKPWTLDFR